MIPSLYIILLAHHIQLYTCQIQNIARKHLRYAQNSTCTSTITLKSSNSQRVLTQTLDYSSQGVLGKASQCQVIPVVE